MVGSTCTNVNRGGGTVAGLSYMMSLSARPFLPEICSVASRAGLLVIPSPGFKLRVLSSRRHKISTRGTRLDSEHSSCRSRSANLVAVGSVSDKGLQGWRLLFFIGAAHA